MSRALTVLDAGPLTTVQDGGRRGYAHLGVPRSGWLDAPAARLANRLVGNDAGAALAETTVGGVTVRAEAALTVAVTGAEADVLVDGHGVAWGEPVSLPAGAVLRVGPARRGVRSYVAVAGGLDVPPVLGLPVHRPALRARSAAPGGRAGAARRTRTPAAPARRTPGGRGRRACSGWRPGRGRTG